MVKSLELINGVELITYSEEFGNGISVTVGTNGITGEDPEHRSRTHIRIESSCNGFTRLHGRDGGIDITVTSGENQKAILDALRWAVNVLCDQTRMIPSESGIDRSDCYEIVPGVYWVNNDRYDGILADRDIVNDLINEDLIRKDRKVVRHGDYYLIEDRLRAISMLEHIVSHREFVIGEERRKHED